MPTRLAMWRVRAEGPSMGRAAAPPWPATLLSMGVGAAPPVGVLCATGPASPPASGDGTGVPTAALQPAECAPPALQGGAPASAGVPLEAGAPAADVAPTVGDTGAPGAARWTSGGPSRGISILTRKMLCSVSRTRLNNVLPPNVERARSKLSAVIMTRESGAGAGASAGVQSAASRRRLRWCMCP